MMLAELMEEAGLPKGVLQVVNGDKVAVDAMLDNPAIQSIGFVGSTPIAEYIYGKGCSNGKRVQGTDLSGSLLDGVRFIGSDLRHALLRGALCRGSRFGSCQLDFADFPGADLSEAGLDGAESMAGADFSQTIGLESQRAALLTRPYAELDTWNPRTRQTTRTSLEA